MILLPEGHEPPYGRDRHAGDAYCAFRDKYGPQMMTVYASELVAVIVPLMRVYSPGIMYLYEPWHSCPKRNATPRLRLSCHHPHSPANAVILHNPPSPSAGAQEVVHFPGLSFVSPQRTGHPSNVTASQAKTSVQNRPYPVSKRDGKSLCNK
jgi:hypothetical protein